jgi:hypothetical protein
MPNWLTCAAGKQVAGWAGASAAGAAGGCGAVQGAARVGWPGMRGGRPGRLPLRWDMIGGVTPEPGVYVARYGWNRRSGSLIIGAAVFVLVALTVPMSMALRVVTLVLFGGGGLVFIAGIASRRVALRVDASGVTLGGSPGRYRSTTILIPWADIREVVLWRQPMPYGRSMRYVGVVRRKGARPLAGRRGRRAGRAAARTLTRGVSADTLLASRAVNLWRLEPHLMADAVAHFAPRVRVIDQETGQVTGPQAAPSPKSTHHRRP